MRLERRTGGAALASWRPDAATSRWTIRPLRLDLLPPADRPDLDAAADGPSCAAVGLDAAFLFVAPLADPGGAGAATLGVWRVADAAAGPAAPERVDVDGPRRPPARMAPSVVVHDGRLLVFGGERDGRILDDLWSVALTGPDAGRWRPHVVRRRQRRTGGVLLSTPDGVVLVGGASLPGQLDVTVYRVDLGRQRPAWDPLPALPFEAGRPWVVFARVDADAAEPATLEVLAWPDAVRPVLVRSGAGGGWTAGPPERGAPNPPADGEGVFVGADFVAAGPSPLPPSEIVCSVGGEGRIAFLPAVDPPADGVPALFTVLDDGSTERWFPAGVPARATLRLGAGRAAPTDRRLAPAARVGVPGRLDWRPLRIRQVSLEPWDQPLALTLDDGVGLDPRLGRFVVRREIGAGALTASVRIGRSGPVGAGFAPPGWTPPPAWIEPGDVVPAPPDVPTAWVSPRTAGLAAPDGTTVVATVADALRSGGLPAAGAAGTVFGAAVLGSPLLPAEVLAVGQEDVVSVWAADTDASPHVRADPPAPATGGGAVSYSLHERLTGPGGEDPDQGPGWFLTGLSLAGGIELAVSAGRLDLRWCSVATPGAAAVRVAGAGHQPALLRHSLPRPRVSVRLYGCQLGTVELPPWVELIAAGCTFDAGGPDAVAIAALGADVRLRHCTVHGRTEAGVLRASSTAFRGTLTCDRTDLSWARYCLLPAGGRPPLLFRSRTHAVSLASQAPTSPAYLRLDENNGSAALRAGEHGRTPGAYDDRAQRETELDVRTEDFLPLALQPSHVDRTAADLDRMNRRLR
jgi:hypothetical protein